MRALLRHCLSLILNVRLVALHLVVNAALIASATFWLLIPEAHVWQLLFAALSALAMICVFLWLHSGTLAYATEPNPQSLRSAFSINLVRLAWALLGFAALFVCMHIVDGWTDSTWQTSGYVYSKAPSFLRPTSGPSSYANALAYAFSILFWYILPTLFLPVITARIVASSALRSLCVLLRWQYWLAMAVAALLGVWVTKQILGWVPGTSLHEQTVGLVARLAIVYILATAAWLIAAGIVGHFLGQVSSPENAASTGTSQPILPASGETQSIIRQCLAVLGDRRLVILQLVGGVVLALVFTLDTPSSDDPLWTMILKIAMPVLLLVPFLWLHSGTLAYAAEPAPQLFSAAFRFRISRMAWLLLALVILVALAAGAESLLWMLNRNDSYVWLISHTISVTSSYLLPTLLLPWTMAKIGTNRGLRSGTAAIRHAQYWLGMAVIVFVANVLSGWLSDWHFGSWTQVGAIIRSTLASLPLVLGWILAAALVGYFVGAAGDRAATNIAGQPAS